MILDPVSVCKLLAYGLGKGFRFPAEHEEHSAQVQGLQLF
jgi:hypothetical protein